MTATTSPVSGTYSYSNTTQTIITVTPNSGYNAVLNVDGSNVTLTSNAYTVNMNQDHFAYVLMTAQ
jgi:hypothetical protein